MVDSLHEETSGSNRMNHKKANRGAGEKKTCTDCAARQSCNLGMDTASFVRGPAFAIFAPPVRPLLTKQVRPFIEVY
jgi:hypothetical protein